MIIRTTVAKTAPVGSGRIPEKGASRGWRDCGRK